MGVPVPSSKQEWTADLARVDGASYGQVLGVVVTHETDLEATPSAGKLALHNEFGICDFPGKWLLDERRLSMVETCNGE